jgi:transketolase
MPLDSLVEKWTSFNWHVQEIDGNNMQAIIDAVHKAQAVFEKPSVIIARTIPGRGVKEFERKFEWHGKAPNKEEAKMALVELRTLGGKIKSEHQ